MYDYLVTKKKCFFVLFFFLQANCDLWKRTYAHIYCVQWRTSNNAAPSINNYSGCSEMKPVNFFHFPYDITGGKMHLEKSCKSIFQIGTCVNTYLFDRFYQVNTCKNTIVHHLKKVCLGAKYLFYHTIHFFCQITWEILRVSRTPMTSDANVKRTCYIITLRPFGDWPSPIYKTW